MTLAVFITVFLALGAISTVSMIGKPRKPIDPMQAAITVAIYAVVIAAVWVWWV